MSICAFRLSDRRFLDVLSVTDETFVLTCALLMVHGCLRAAVGVNMGVIS